jgi:hypothetical protein
MIKVLVKTFVLPTPTMSQCYKTFYVINLRMFVISESVCSWQVFPAYSNVSGQGQEPTLEWSM